ncbi:MAG: hypothetical protein AAF790_09050 [Planctomycetota bacterium]
MTDPQTLATKARAKLDQHAAANAEIVGRLIDDRHGAERFFALLQPRNDAEFAAEVADVATFAKVVKSMALESYMRHVSEILEQCIEDEGC